MAEDDVDFRVILSKDNGWALGKETQARSLPPAADQPTPSLSPSELSPSQPSTSLRSSSSSLPPVEELDHVSYKMQDDTNSQGGEEAFGVVSGGRWDKSLGVLCQKFIMLFLITPVSHLYTWLASQMRLKYKVKSYMGIISSTCLSLM